MWQAIVLQCLSCGVVAASLYAKSSPDFNSPVSAGLMVAALIIAILSIKAYMDQERDNRRMRHKIDSLIRSVTPNERVSESVRETISKMAPGGYGLCELSVFSGGMEFFTFFSESKARGGLLIVERKDMCELALVNEEDLDDAVRRFMGATLRVDDFWNRLGEELSLAARYVVEGRSLAYPMFNRVWYDTDHKKIGIATEAVFSEPDLILDHDEQMHIIKMRRVDRHLYLVNRIEAQLDKAKGVN